MSSRSIRFWLLLLVLLPLNSLLATGINDVRWKGNDFVMTFADSIRYQVDLAESDSTRVVLRLSGVQPGTGYTQRQVAGPNRTVALLTTSPEGLRVTITAPTRIGYSTIWHPYSHRLVVHTFDWNRLSYGEEQYHKGLLAFEGRYSIAAEEMLKVAEATGETRARTALGTWYLGRGQDSLASRYLDSAVTADDHAALAELRRRRGDSTTATREAEIARMMIADEIRTGGDAAPPAESTVDDEVAPVSRGAEARSRNEMYYLGGGVLLLLLIVGAVIFFTRKPKAPQNVAEGRIAPRRSTPDVVIERTAAPVEERVVVTQSVPEPTIQQEHLEPSQPESARIEPTPVEPSPAEPVASDPVTSDPVATTSLPGARFPSVTTVEELPPLEEGDAEIAPIVTRHPAPEPQPARPETSIEEEQTATEPTGPAGPAGPRLPSQAAALQRKIKSVRRDAPAPAEPTVYAARRLNVSRDNIELRKMMEAARRAHH